MSPSSRDGCCTTATTTPRRSRRSTRWSTTLDGRPSPFDGLSWYRGDSLARLDRHPEAIEAFERAIAEAPFDLRAYTSLATLQHAMHRDEAAVATVERLVRAVPTPAGYATAVRLFALIGERTRSVELRAEARVRFAGESARPAAPVPASAFFDCSRRAELQLCAGGSSKELPYVASGRAAIIGRAAV